MTVLSLLIQILSVVLVVGFVAMSGSATSIAALSELTNGRFALMFWLGAIVVGSVLPLAIGLVDLKRRSVGLTAIASALVIVGGFLVKYVFMAAGQA